MIVVADTYNHKVKVVDPFRNEAFTWLGGKETSPENTLVDGTTNFAAFNEPQGIASIYDTKQQDVKVFICDTNNHCVRMCHYDVGHVTTPEFRGVPRTQCEFQSTEDIRKSEKVKQVMQAEGDLAIDIRCDPSGKCVLVK